ncbi:hypothetical protein HBA54_19225 [Pelagibius litoralis]|uniref:Uncharacterized protein n=1 Tax=Pelagibius litoralis TaxID=374515 RepID=A0A967F0G2_9PROT|nr:hypothetical protein [Pelagibius litoralis]NIA70735.1 hypothetical protein [Pelagibius litoralis]
MNQTPREIAKELSQMMQCNCDLDNWEPEQDTGHSWVCGIHNATLLRLGKNAPRPDSIEVSKRRFRERQEWAKKFAPPNAQKCPS